MTDNDKKPNADKQSIPSSVNPDAKPVSQNTMNQNNTETDEESGIEHLRCTTCADRVGIVKERGTRYAVCHCTYDDGSLDRMELESLEYLRPTRWEYF